MMLQCLEVARTILFLLILCSVVRAQYQLRRQRRHGHPHGRKKLEFDTCDTKFVKYQSSPYESRWLTEINLRELNVCLYLTREVADQTLLYQVTQTSHDNHYTNMTRSNLFKVFSMFIYQRTCPNPEENIVFIEPIEPLHGYLRDHRSICEQMTPEWSPEMPRSKTGFGDRRYLLLSSKTNSPRIFQSHRIAEYEPTLLILDIGCGSYNGQVNGTKTLGDSIAWFMRQYIPKGFKLGKYIAWEEFPMNQEEFFAALPADLITRFTFFNAKISAEPTSRMYPWRFLAELAHDYDHVVIKMDNNQYPVEIALLKILAGDSTLLELIDEMYFEFHFKNPPLPQMAAEVRTKATLSDAYDLFLKIRQAGVRMHGWP